MKNEPIPMLSRRVFWVALAGAALSAVAAAVPILFSAVMNRSAEIPKNALAEPLAVLALGAMLVACGWRGLVPQTVAARFAAAAFVIFLVLAGLSTVLSDMPWVALYGSYFRREGLLVWCAYGAFFFAMLAWARDARRVGGFLDALLIASVIPAVYAIQQRVGMDIYYIIDQDPTRPGSTLGNPLFLATYLAMLLPVTLVRCWESRGTSAQFVSWAALALLQAGELLLSQSRGPLFAAITGLLLLACMAAGRARMRGVFFIIAAAPPLFAAGLALINGVPAAKSWAQDVPVLSRLVFNPDHGTGDSSLRASKSSLSRLGIWGAGSETFLNAPLSSQLLGYGPDSAYMHYFQNMPATVMETEGYLAANTYDRLHADIYDIALNFGLLGWLIYSLLFGAVLYAAARALFGLHGARPLWIFAGGCVGSGALALSAAVAVGLPTAAVPAFGLGMAGGGVIFFAACSWRMSDRATPQANWPAGQWALLAALVSSLLMFWIDAQVNIPVLTTRFVSFTFAALALVISAGILTREENETTHNEGFLPWAAACAITAAGSSFFGAVDLDAAVPLPAHSVWLVLAPILAGAVAFAAFAAARHAWRGGGRIAWPRLAFAACVPLAYAVCYFALASSIGTDHGAQRAQRIALAACSGPLLIFLLCPAYAAWQSARVVSQSGRRHTPVLPAVALAMALSWVFFLAWRAVLADVSSTEAQVASRSPSNAGIELIQDAIRAMPYERQYHRQLIFEALGRASADIGKMAEDSTLYPGIARSLDLAEREARITARMFPGDPWSLVALANVLQFRALPALRPADPDAGRRAAEEARELFRSTHRMFPSQPLVLRNWAQLEFYEGNPLEAYRLLDLMEDLIPSQFEPYYERLVIAMQLNDYQTINSALRRASRALDKRSMERLKSVVTSQQGK